MILQKFAKSLRNQDWFTVFIEILVVVVGLFLGLQVNNWNEARKSANWEHRFLTDLSTEFRSNREQLRQVLDWQTQRGAALEKTHKLLLDHRTDDSLIEISAAYSLAMSSNRTFFPTSGVYLSALSTGSIDEVRNKRLRYAIMDIYERAYPRLVYNGEIYDERSDQVSWDNRQYFDPGNGTLRGIEPVHSPAFISNVRFLAEQNRIYVGLAETVFSELDAVISEFPKASAEE
jgi:hypothetical protein